MSVTTYNNRTTDPEIPDLGKVKFYMKNKEPTWRDDTGAVNTLALPVFGKNVDLSIYEDYTKTTSGTAWSTYAGLQMPVGSDGTYIVFAPVISRMSSTGGDARIRVAKNSTTVGEYAAEEFKDTASNQRVPRTLIKKVVLVAGDYLDLDISTERSGDTITVYEGLLILWRIA